MNYIPWDELTESQRQSVIAEPGWEIEPEKYVYKIEAGEVTSRAPVLGVGTAEPETEQAPAGHRPPLQEDQWRVVLVKRGELMPCALNPRKHFDAGHLDKLALNLRELGVINPLTTRPCQPTKKYPEARFEICGGECRWRSSEERAHPFEKSTLAAIEELPIIVRALSDADALQLMLSENMQRNDLTELEECDAFALAMQQRDKDGVLVYPTQQALAKAIGVEANHVHRRLSLRNLPPLGRAALLKKQINYKTALQVARCPAGIMAEVLDCVLNPNAHEIWTEGVLTAEQTREVIQTRFMRSLSDPPFDPEDAALLPVRVENGARIEGGACGDCPWNTLNQNEEMETAKPVRPGQRGKAQSCTNVACFAKKVELAAEGELRKAEADGCEVASGDEARKIIEHPADWVELSQKPGVDDRSRHVDEMLLPTWGEIVAGAVTVNAVVGRDKASGDAISDKVTAHLEVPVTAVLDEAGHVRKFVKRELALAAADKRGTSKYLNSKTLTRRATTATPAGDVDEAKIRQAVSFAVLGELLPKVAGENEPKAFWDWLMDVSARHATKDGLFYMCKRRGERHGIDEMDACDGYMRAAKTEGEKRALVAEFLLARAVKFNGLADDHLLALCKIYRVNPEKITKRLFSEKEKAEKAAHAAERRGLPALRKKLAALRAEKGLTERELIELAAKACGREWKNFTIVADYEMALRALEAMPAKKNRLAAAAQEFRDFEQLSEEEQARVRELYPDEENRAELRFAFRDGALIWQERRLAKPKKPVRKKRGGLTPAARAKLAAAMKARWAARKKEVAK